MLTPADLRLLTIVGERQLAEYGVDASGDPFEDEPVPLDRWLGDGHYCNLGITPGPLQMAALRHLEWVYFPATWEALGWVRPDVDLVNMIVLKVGKGGGKDMISQVGLLRIAYLLQCLKHPQGYYGLASHSTIHMTNIAVNATQANSVFYTGVKALIESSRYWRDRAHPGVGKTTFDKRVELISGHSDVGAQEGMNLLAGVADEIAEFKTQEEVEASRRAGGARAPKQSAEAVDGLIRSSARSRFAAVFKAAYLSWTRFKGDYIEKMYAEGEREIKKHGKASRWWILHASTWEFNPAKTREELQPDYDKDPEDARGRYECIPPKSQGRFMRNMVALRRAFPERDWHPVTYRLEQGYDPDNPGQYGWQAVFDFDPSFVPVQGPAYAVHIDLAHTHDKAGFAMCHVSGYRHRQQLDENEEVRLIRMEEVTMDLALGFDQGPHGEIELRWPRALLFRLVERGFRIVYVTLDGWQSVDTIQILNATLGNTSSTASAEQRKIAENFSLDRTTEGYDLLKSLVYGGLFKGWRTPPVDDEECKWWEEITALQRTSGNARFARIDHPPYGSKDVADAIAGAARGAIRADRIWGSADFGEFWVGASTEEQAPVDALAYRGPG